MHKIWVLICFFVGGFRWIETNDNVRSITMATPAPGLPLSPTLWEHEGQMGAVDIGRDFYKWDLYDVETVSSLSSDSRVVARESSLQFGGQSMGKTSHARLICEGRFSTFVKKVQLDAVKASPGWETLISNEGSPRYIADSPRGVISIETSLCSPDQHHSNKSLMSLSDEEMIEVPRTRMITSRKHLDKLLCIPPPLCPPSPPSNHVEQGHCRSDDLEVSQQSKTCERDSSVITNEGFWAYIGEKISYSSCQMRFFVAIGIIDFLVWIIAVMAESLTIIGNKNNGNDAESFKVNHPLEDGSNIPPDKCQCGLSAFCWHLGCKPSYSWQPCYTSQSQ